MDARHTSAPWLVAHHGASVHAGGIVIRQFGGLIPEVKANARLTAAAPELMAIRRVMAAIQELASALGDDVVQAKVAPAPRDELRPRALCPGCPV